METENAPMFALLGDAFCYPSTGHLAALEVSLNRLPESREKDAVADFLEKIRRLTLGEWEELHTRTLDLNPPAAPYIGFQTWGESYQRGVFLSKMNRELLEAGIDLDGELPDHISPVLRYLGQTAEPLPELINVLTPAIQRIEAVLRKADPHNPYLDLLEAVQGLCNDLKQEAV